MDIEDCGGDPPCWAHLFEADDDPEDKPSAAGLDMCPDARRPTGAVARVARDQPGDDR